MTHSSFRSLVAALLWTITLTPAAWGADPANGERLAARWCAACHVVSPTQSRAQADAPSFAAISASRRIPQIEGFLKESHPQMPDMALTRDEIADLIAYMHTLAPPVDPAPAPGQKDDHTLPERG